MTGDHTNVVRRVFENSLNRFLREEAQAILGDVNERSNCGRLGIYLQEVATEAGLRGYFADVEYNRKQNGQVKTILDEQGKIVTINCDLILHSRGASNADNLVAVELKKAHRPAAEKTKDRDRLRALTKASYDGVWSADGITQPEHVCGYALGVYVEIDRRRRLCRTEYFVKGEQVEHREIHF